MLLLKTLCKNLFYFNLKNVTVLIGILFVIILKCICETKSLDAEYCESLKENTLTVLLGSAYNPRYMSIDAPPTPSNIDSKQYKRSSIEFPFSVDGEYRKEISEQPAWEINYIQSSLVYEPENDYHVRRRRSVSRDLSKAFIDNISMQSSNSFKKSSIGAPFSPRGAASKGDLFKSRPWDCAGKIIWKDLGHDYFPRYLRTVECLKRECWYSQFVCKPKSFTIKVLKRRKGECVPAGEKLRIASGNAIDGEYAELWIWEEKAVNFCCDCVVNW